MDAELSRTVARAKLSPWWAEKASTENFTDNFIDAAVKAGTLSALPARLKSFLEMCDRSMKVAERLGAKDFTTAASRRKVIDALIEELPGITEEEEV